MTANLSYLLSGIVLGISGGLSPGPLLTLVISETLKHGAGAGMKVAVAPLLTDLPIILVGLLFFSHVANIQPLLGLITCAGAVFLAYLAYESLRFQGMEMRGAESNSRSLRKGVIANALNPSPYLFWFTIGSPLIVKAASSGIAPAVLFVLGFYATLIGSKMTVAVAVGKTRGFLKSHLYVYAIRLLGVCLLGFAGFFLHDGLKAW